MPSSSSISSIPGIRDQGLADKATGILIFPVIIKGGVALANEYGHGVLMVNGTTRGYFSQTARAGPSRPTPSAGPAMQKFSAHFGFEPARNPNDSTEVVHTLHMSHLPRVDLRHPEVRIPRPAPRTAPRTHARSRSLRRHPRQPYPFGNNRFSRASRDSCSR
jgi:hypothetical protein